MAYGGSSFVGVSLSPTNTNSPSLLSPRVSIETRVGANTWLILNATASYASFEELVVSSSPTPPTGDERKTLAVSTTRLAALLGLRHIVMRGIVDVSLYVAAGVSRERAGGDAPEGSETVYPIVPGSKATSVGAVGGLAVEKELLRGLAARITTDLLGASYGSVDQVQWLDGVATPTTFTSGNVGLALSPALLVQFYF